MRIESEPILSFVLRQLDSAKGNWPEISRQSGVPYQTLTKIAGRLVVDPRISTVQALLDCLTEREAGMGNPASASSSSQ
ncbi:hypothetical protein [Burkholderia gladioli]|uniref:hypothetical protein n=1 Tax=Burkholderia gladioli TaxID=28095 RepID=UPI00163F3F9F|nr:hypothetical protein [Burkholderia gladioli]